MAWLDFWKPFGISDFLDIVFMSMLIYSFIIWFKRSKAAFVLLGISLVGMVYIIARELNLQLVAAVFQGFFAVILIALIVIFQEEIKHVFERLAVWSLNRGVPRQQVVRLTRKEVEILVRTLFDLSEQRIGALVVLKGNDIISRHINGGIDLNGEMSEALIKSLFDPHSIGHDGAVIIEGNRITQFGCHLPLSKDISKIPNGGTRHAAALGLCEASDALCLIVSEERGSISHARYGDMSPVTNQEQLNTLLERFYEEVYPSQRTRVWQDFFRRNIREKMIALFVTLGLWFYFVHEGKRTYKAFSIPVEYTNLPVEINHVEIRPRDVEMTFSGSRRYFYFIKKDRIKLVINLTDAKVGFQTKQLQKSNVTYPNSLSLENISPNKVKVILSERTPTDPS